MARPVIKQEGIVNFTSSTNFRKLLALLQFRGVAVGGEGEKKLKAAVAGKNGGVR